MAAAHVTQFVGQDRGDFVVLFRQIDQLVGDEYDPVGKREGIGADSAAVTKFHTTGGRGTAGGNHAAEQGGQLRATLRSQLRGLGKQAVEHDQRLASHAAFNSRGEGKGRLSGQGRYAEAHEKHHDKRRRPKCGRHQRQAFLPAVQQRGTVTFALPALQICHKGRISHFAHSAVRQADRATDRADSRRQLYSVQRIGTLNVIVLNEQSARLYDQSNIAAGRNHAVEIATVS